MSQDVLQGRGIRLPLATRCHGDSETWLHHDVVMSCHSDGEMPVQ